MEQLNQVIDGNTIAFAYLRTLKMRKKQFFVLRSMPQPSPWEQQQQQQQQKPQSMLPDSMKDYFLYVFKNEKHYQKRQPRRVYNMSGIILLTRCTKKDNRTVLGICFQEDALFLRFDTEDELNRWYFHLSNIHTLKRNCRWPELTHCFSVLLKPRALPAPSTGRHASRSDLAGAYRLCLTDSAVLLVRDCLLNPTLTLPFRCIRSCVHSVSASFFQIHLGRLSPIGEGVLHFEAEQVSMMKEIVEALMRCLNEASSHRLHQTAPVVGAATQLPAAPFEKPKARLGYLSARRHSKEVLSGLRQQIQHRTGQLVAGQLRSSAAVFNTRCSSAIYSDQPALSSLQCSGAVRAGALECGLRSSSQPLSLMPSEADEDDYLDLSGTFSGGASHSVAGGLWMPQDTASQSPSSVSSVSVCGATAGDCAAGDRASAIAAAAAATLASVAASSSGSPSPGLAGRANSLSGFGHGRNPQHLQQLQQQQYILAQRQRVRQQSIACGFNGGGGGGFGGGGGHRDDRQLFVELSFPRPRTASDAASAQRWPRNRAGSYGTRSVCNGRLGSSGGGGGPWMSSAERMNSGDPSDSGEGSYVLMGLGNSALKCTDSSANSPNLNVRCTGKEEYFEDESNDGELADEEDPYWVMPSRLDQRLKLPDSEAASE